MAKPVVCDRVVAAWGTEVHCGSIFAVLPHDEYKVQWASEFSISILPASCVRRVENINNHGLYDILGLSSDASDSDIKKAYKKVAARLHPDKGGDKAAFQDLSDAYKILTGPLRTHYCYDSS